MKKQWIKIGILFLVTVGAVFWALNYLFLSGQTAQKSKASGETIQLTYDPASTTAAVNTDFSVGIKIKPSGDVTLRGYYIYLYFDKLKLQLKKIEYKLGTVSTGLGYTDTDLTTANTSGLVKLIGENQIPTGQLLSSSSSTDLVKLTFTALSNTGTSFTINTNLAGFYTFGSDMLLYYRPISAAAQFSVVGSGGATGTPSMTITPGGPTLTPTPTGTVTGNTKINLRLKFQGITAKPADTRNSMNVKFTLSGADLTTPLVKSGTFTADANGVWSGKVGFDLTSPSGKKYILYAKGPRHIQKKICDIASTDTSPGTYSCSTANFTLAIGDNTRDLSKILLLSGDIYGPNKVQDGVVNSIDLSFVKNNLNKTEAAILAVCDINLDGKCDTQDYSLIISSLSIKSDEQ